MSCCYEETHARTNRKSTVKSDGRLLEIHTASTTTTAHTCTRHYFAELLVATADWEKLVEETTFGV